MDKKLKEKEESFFYLIIKCVQENLFFQTAIEHLEIAEKNEENSEEEAE